MEIKIGQIFHSNYYGPVKILDKNKRPGYYLVRFLDTGTEKAFRDSQIKSGCIRDPFAKRLCGVACTGDVSTKGKNAIYYSIWHDMINRCYNPHDKRAKAYKNVSVCERWMVFKNFLEDISTIEGYEASLVEAGDLVLDKDLKQRHMASKTYSVATCSWVPKSVNNTIQEGQQRMFVGISPTGEQFESDNITAFAREHSLTRRHISGVLHGRCKTTGGWKFYFKDIFYEEIV